MTKVSMNYHNLFQIGGMTDSDQHDILSQLCYESHLSQTQPK